MTTIAPMPSPSLPSRTGAGRPARGSSEEGIRPPAEFGPIALSHRVSLSAILTVVRITAARQSRGIRLVIIALLFSLPIIIAVVTRHSRRLIGPSRSRAT